MSPFQPQNKLLSRCELSRLAPHPTDTACPMRSTTGIQEENDCGINYFWRRLSQIPPRSRTGWMVIPQTAQVYVYCIRWLETLPSVCENSAGGMLVQDLLPFTLSFWPLFVGHCLLSLFLLSCQVSTARQFTHEDLQACTVSDGAQIRAAQPNALRRLLM